MAEANGFEEPLCGCTKDMKSCLISWCVPCGSQCVQGMAINEASAGSESCFVPCLLAAFLGCIGSAINRGNIRNRYRIDGNFIVDLLISWFCLPCVSCQMYREVQWRNQTKRT
ncbi:unnamed protein product [Blepharisma stoltei]|uniref:Uncharacterized protein n=1 Tax=Blepharisma stoltei TaxID=1481888 RepID=A0AAU9ISX7_9CILI|nr:unnamed protein product [Blepharisma stoltei]